jgi:hypothetical protein
MVSMRLASDICARIIAATLALSSATLIACGTGDGDDVPPRPTFAVEQLPTIADVTTVPLTPATGAIPGYTISVPPNWVPGEAQPLGEDTFDLKRGTGNAAQIAVLCEPPVSREGRRLTALDYANNDIAYIREVRGQAEPPVQFLHSTGEPAASVLYQTTFGPLSVRQKSVHLVDDQCHWSIRLRVYAPGDMTGYLELFDRVVQSFVST